MSWSKEYRRALLKVGKEIDDFRQWEGQRRVIHVLLPDKVYLPVSPFDGRQPISDVGRKSFAVGVFLFAQQEIRLIDTVNRAILRNLRFTHTGKGRIEVYDVNDLVADSARWNLTWPSDNERRT